MIRWVLILMVIPAIASSQSISIRSGEHDTFSRLVLSIGEGTEWQVNSTPDGYVLELTGPTDGFNTTAVFERIPRNRISEISQQALNILKLSIACDCYADAFLWRPGELVLDIIDGPDPDPSTQNPTPLDTVASQPNDMPSALPDLLALNHGVPDLLLSLETTTHEQSVTDLAPIDQNGTSAAASMELQHASIEPDLEAAERALIDGLARAATQGFLDPALDPQHEPVIDEPRPGSFRDLPGPVPVVGQPGVGISTAMDRDLGLLEDVLGAAGGRQCLPNDLFQLGEWADDRALHSQVAEMAEELAGAFGQETLEAENNLARLYIHFGFGAEARSVLSADTALSQSRRVLLELAGIVDDYPSPYPLIATQTGCPTAAALWAFYSNPTPLDVDHRNHILQIFFAVPQPLRGQLAPRMARKFIAIGDPDTASRVLRASENQDSEVTHDVQATRALIAENVANPLDAIAVLDEEADDNARISPQSLIRLIQLELQQGQIPQESNLILAAAMRQEYGDSQIAGDLAISEAQGRIARGQYDAALSLAIGRNSDEAYEVVNQAFAHIAEHAKASVFLEFGYADLPNELTEQSKNMMARRMIDLGFPDRAAEMLDDLAQGEAEGERRYLRAEAAIGSQNYDAAIDALVGITDPRANDLRALAYSGLGEHREALSAAGSEETMLEFRAGAWDRLRVEDDEVLANFAEAILTLGVTDPTDSLADRRAILQQSADSRRAIEALLQRFDGTTPQE